MQRAEHIDRLNRDRPGGHHPTSLVDGAFYREDGRRFAKKLDRKKARRQARKLTTEALHDYEADYQYWYEQYMTDPDEDWDYDLCYNEEPSRDLSWEDDPYWREEAEFNAYYDHWDYDYPV